MLDHRSLIWLAVAGVTTLVIVMLARPDDDRGLPVRVKVPLLSSEAQAGQALFEQNCMACHGKNAAGTKNGPPLVHRVYHPGHHADAAFELAVLRGVKAHHWNFGDMPTIPTVTQAQVRKITTYVRELQRANGIF